MPKEKWTETGPDTAAGKSHSRYIVYITLDKYMVQIQIKTTNVITFPGESKLCQPSCYNFLGHSHRPLLSMPNNKIIWD